MITKQEDGKWLVDIRLEGRGSKRARKKFTTQREAKEFENWYKSQQTADVWEKQKDNRRLDDAIERWWKEFGATQSSGKDKYGRLKRMSTRLNNPLLRQINEEMLMKYRAERIDESNPEHVSFSTANKEMIYISSILKHVKVDVPKVKRLKVKSDELKYLEIEQANRLLTELKRRSFGVYVHAKVCFETGARLSEAASILPTHVKDGVLSLPSKHTKNNKARYIPISNELEKLIKENAPFPELVSIFRRSLSACEIELPAGQLTHVMRHTFAAHYLMNGGNIVALQKVLDHGDLNVTMRYAHLSRDHLQNVLEFKPKLE
jgi:integrase